MENLPHDLVEMIFYLSCQFIIMDTTVLDLSCDSGEVLAPLVASQWDDLTVLACNPAEGAKIDANGYHANTYHQDISIDYPDCLASVTLAVGTMQQYDIATRQKVLLNAYKQTLPGGALILVERVMSDSFDLTDTFKNVALSMYDHCDEVTQAITPALHTECMLEAGFSQVECFYKGLDLAGFIALKQE